MERILKLKVCQRLMYFLFPVIVLKDFTEIKGCDDQVVTTLT